MTRSFTYCKPIPNFHEQRDFNAYFYSFLFRFLIFLDAVAYLTDHRRRD